MELNYYYLVLLFDFVYYVSNHIYHNGDILYIRLYFNHLIGIVFIFLLLFNLCNNEIRKSEESSNE